MKRIELELYADRLGRHAERLREDIETARMHLAWAALEGRCREQLGGRDCAALEVLGVFTACDESAERRLIERRVAQLRSVERLQGLVELEIERTG